MREADIQTLDDMDGIEKKEEVGIGYKITEGWHGDFHTGEMVYIEDKDAGQHADECPLINSREFVASVEAIYAVDYDTIDGYTLEIGTHAPIGRVDIEDADAVGEGFSDHRQTLVEKYLNEFHVAREKLESGYVMRELHHEGDAPADLWEQHEQRGCWFSEGETDATRWEVQRA